MSNRREAKANRTELSLKRGSIKDAIGKLTGSATAEAEGKTEGKAEQQSPKSDAKPGSTRTP